MKPRLIFSLLALLAFNHMVHAELVFDISEEIVSPTQTNLLISISGSVDTDGLTFLFAGTSGAPNFNPQQPTIVLSSTLSPAGGNVDVYALPNELPSLGTMSGFPSITDFTGDIVGFYLSTDQLLVPQNYISETPLSASMTVVDRNFDSFSLVAGESYTVPWAEGTANEDSLTVNIVPEPSSILLIGTAGGLLALARQKRPYTWREK